MRWGIILLCGALASCATPYQEMGFTGGVSAVRIDETHVNVTSIGNSFSSPERTAAFLLRKAAEETINAGYVAFRVDDAQDRGQVISFTSPGTATTTTNASVYGAGNMAFGTATSNTTYMPAQTTNSYKPGASAQITMLKAMPAEPMFRVYNAADVLRFAAMNDTKK